MEILKSDARTVVLESYAITRETPDEPVKIRAQLVVTMPQMTPSVMRVLVEYEYDNIPNQNERDLGRRLLELLSARVVP